MLAWIKLKSAFLPLPSQNFMLEVWRMFLSTE